MQVVVTAGVAIASYGEINFVPLGVLLQLISVATESTRLSLVQILLQACAGGCARACAVWRGPVSHGPPCILCAACALARHACMLAVRHACTSPHRMLWQHPSHADGSSVLGGVHPACAVCHLRPPPRHAQI